MIETNSQALLYGKAVCRSVISYYLSICMFPRTIEAVTELVKKDRCRICRHRCVNELLGECKGLKFTVMEIA